MYLIRKFLAFCVLPGLVWMNPAVTEKPSCCYVMLSNGSANYTLNFPVTFESFFWNKNNVAIKDEDGSINSDVLNFGANWILLNQNYSGVEFSSTSPGRPINTKFPILCADPCNSGKVNRLKEGGGGDRGEGGHGTDGTGGDFTTAIIGVIAVIIIIIFIIIIIMWKLGFCSKHTANRPKANPANGGFRAVPQEDQEESGV
ncbi:uncharacterized protein LOC131342260 [Hemibagrus wyckioides]|uniref:uncharacterized protein LOC131342260 n=1 Tax=Hemibagrus wyckioides TaxID=337641 RepID=UPI00266BE044|nr:uncharacterized protein LOC131342260 [Hemibagrus wyckioides]